MAKQNLYVVSEGALYQGGSGNDTIANFTGKFSSNTIKGGDGNDLITFAYQTTAVGLSAGKLTNISAGPHLSAGSKLTVVYNGPTISAGSPATKTTGVISFTSAGTATNVLSFTSLTNTALLTGHRSFIQGGAGNDTIQFGDYITNASGNTVLGGAGNDTIGSYNSGASTAGKFNGAFLANQLKGGKGNDTINIDISSTSAKKFVLNGNSGNDTIIFSAITDVALSGQSGAIYGGKGNDNITYNNSAGNSKALIIGGGDGNDSIDFQNNGGTVSKANITLDASNASTGTDTITLDLGTISGSTINGYAGVDSIILSALDTDGGGNLIEGGRGNDVIRFATATFNFSGSTIQGGQGNDQINNSGKEFATGNAQVIKSSLIRLGAGTDVLSLSGAIESAGTEGLTVVGGLGADVMNVQSIGTAGSGTFAFSAYTESPIGSGDTIAIQANQPSSQAATTQNSAHVNFSIPDTVSFASGSTTAVGGGVSGVSGIIAFSGVGDNLTARVNALDTAFSTTGTVAFFTVQDNNEFFFVQGGANDLVVKMQDSTLLSAGVKDSTLSLVKSGNIFGFGGN